MQLQMPNQMMDQYSYNINLSGGAPQVQPQAFNGQQMPQQSVNQQQTFQPQVNQQRAYQQQVNQQQVYQQPFTQSQKEALQENQPRSTRDLIKQRKQQQHDEGIDFDQYNETPPEQKLVGQGQVKVNPKFNMKILFDDD
ncbi:hypothetical protein FGO68_gene10907 [Halteria grandinella]|uniref:Uncharacterized protein n=1 Tax=Halteria grandinella TaxID=5974 RepID=A0A8J8T776_HALGN|nr:hypothetical protein FGO68_gene10907 [Halteria grandinella]